MNSTLCTKACRQVSVVQPGYPSCHECNAFTVRHNMAWPCRTHQCRPVIASDINSSLQVVQSLSSQRPQALGGTADLFKQAASMAAVGISQLVGLQPGSSSFLLLLLCLLRQLIELAAQAG